MYFTEDEFNNSIFHLARSCQRKLPCHGRLAKLKRNKTSALNTRELKGAPLFYMQCKLTNVSAYSESKTKRQARKSCKLFYKMDSFLRFKWKLKRLQTNTNLEVNPSGVPFGR